MQDQKGFDIDEAGLDTGFTDPLFNQLQADTEASPQEEAALQEGLLSFMETLYDKETIVNVASILEEEGELYDKVPRIIVPMLQKVKAEVKNAPPSIFFGENGLIQLAVPLIWEIAENERIPGYQDPDQISGAMINLYRMVGEHLDKSGDKLARSQAQDMAISMALTNPDGSMADPDSMIEENPLTDAVKKATALGV